MTRLDDWTYRAWLDGRDVTCYLAADTRISWGRLTRAEQPEASTCTLVMRDEDGAVNPLIGQRVGVDAVYQGTQYPRFRGTVSSAEVGTGYDELVVVASGPLAKLARTMVDIPWSAESDGERIERILSGETTTSDRFVMPTTTGWAEYSTGANLYPTDHMLILGGMFHHLSDTVFWTSMTYEGRPVTHGPAGVWTPLFSDVPWLEAMWVETGPGGTVQGWNAFRTMLTTPPGTRHYWWSTIHEDLEPWIDIGIIGSTFYAGPLAFSSDVTDPSKTKSGNRWFEITQLEVRNSVGPALIGGLLRYYWGPVLDLSAPTPVWTWSAEDAAVQQGAGRNSLVTYGTRAMGGALGTGLGGTLSVTLESWDALTTSVRIHASTHGTRPTLSPADGIFPTGRIPGAYIDYPIVSTLPPGAVLSFGMDPALMDLFRGGTAKGWEIEAIGTGTLDVVASGFDMVVLDGQEALAGDIDDGWVTIAERTIVSGVDTRSKLDLLREAAIAALGIILETFDGHVEFQGAHHRQPRAPDVVLDCDEILKEMRWRDDIADLLNDLAYTYGDQHHADAATFKGRVQDAASIAEFGTYGANMYLALSNATDAASVATQLIAWRKQPFWTLETLPVRLEIVPNVPVALTLHISGLVQLTNIPEPTPATTGYWWVEGGEETLSVRGWTIGFYVSPYDTSVIPA